MSVTVGGTSITFNDGTTQTTAATGGVASLNGQTGAITNTSLYAIGSYVTGRPANSTFYSANSTVAGSSLYNTGPSVYYYATGQTYTANGPCSQAGQTLVNTGSWRCVSAAANEGNYSNSGLWVRYA